MARIKELIEFLSQFPEDAEVHIQNDIDLYGVSFITKKLDIRYHYDFNEHFEWYGGSETLILGLIPND